MKTKNSMQLKALIKKQAIKSDIAAQIIMQNYMMERLLERISLSEYRSNFILKGGFLIAAIVGLDTRATMDLDTTVKHLSLNKETLQRVFEEIVSVPVEDDIVFEIVSLTDIREADDYPGIRVALKAKYLPLNVPLSVDVTTDDRITPQEREYSFRLLFDERTISIMAYNLETILAEKLETILSRSVANTRPRDFYDVYILYTLRRQEYSSAILKEALEKTVTKRGSLHVLTEYAQIMDSIQISETLQGFWRKYQKEFSYAREITFEDTCNCIRSIMENISE